MNREETKKAIEVMQAWLDGRDILINSRTLLVCEPDWNWYQAEYSVKSNEYHVYLNASGQPFDVTHATVDTKQGMRTVKVREVTE